MRGLHDSLSATITGTEISNAQVYRCELDLSDSNLALPSLSRPVNNAGSGDHSCQKIFAKMKVFGNYLYLL